jgi:hypothetical protein
MHSLRDLQERFAEAVFNPRSYGLDLPIRENGLNGRRRLRIYCNNVFASLTEALRACYPVVERLVGVGFFAYVANRYIRSHPSTSGDLQEFGSEFPEFLEDFPTTRALVYLSDVARLEWARQYVYHALEPEVVELSTRLQAVPPNGMGIFGSVCTRPASCCSRLIQYCGSGRSTRRIIAARRSGRIFQRALSTCSLFDGVSLLRWNR